MATSLKTRLWISYLILSAVIMVALCSGVIIALARNPLLYRATLVRLTTVDTLLSARLQDGDNLFGVNAESLIAKIAKQHSVRILILDQNLTPLLDTDSGRLLRFGSGVVETSQADRENLKFPLTRDKSGKAWFYLALSLPKGDRWLIIAAPRTLLSLRLILWDDILRPFYITILIDLILALLIALVMSNWIAKPLQKLATASREVARGNFHLVALEGPLEIQQLAQTFNEMVKRVETSQREQREFIANISHELKTPLTSIQGFAQAILDGTVSTPEQERSSVEIIHAEAERMNRMVLDLLNLAKLEAGIAEMTFQTVHLSEVLRQLVQRLQPQAASAQVALTVELDDLPEIRGDGERLVEVFTNLIENGLKFTPAHGSVVISAHKVQNTILIKVQDSGIGIAPEHQKRIFGRFFQVEKSRRGGVGHGIGLGLPIAQQIVRAHGGELSVESTPGNGSAFIVQLPIHLPTQTARE